MQYTPTVVYNGSELVVGASSPQQYMTNILNRSLEPSPIQIVIDSFNPATGAVSATVTMHSTTTSLVDEDFHLVLVEDDPEPPPPPPTVESATHVTRALLSDSISLTGAGNTVTFNKTFTISPSWNQSNLRVMAFVQLTNKEIVQGGSSDAQPAFKIRAMVPFSRATIGSSSVAYESSSLTLMNTGLTETFSISLAIDAITPGWSVAFKDNGGTTHTDPFVFGLSGDSQTTFTTVVTPASAGFARYRLIVTSANLARPLEVPFVHVSDDAGVLIIDDDGGESYEDYFATALDSGGKAYGMWDRDMSPLTTEVADNFDVLIWNVGWAFPSLDEDDQMFLSQHLDAGKSLFLSGQDIGWELNNSSPSAWYQSYLHAFYVRDDTNIMDLDGVTGDPITDGLDLHIAGGTGANNQTYPDEIRANDADATVILNYRGDGGGAIKSQDSLSGARVVYLGFGFEGIDDALDRQDLLIPAVNWLDILFHDNFESGDFSRWSSVSP